MDGIVTFEDEQVHGVSLPELRGLFEDHPTIPLVDAMREQLPGKITEAMELVRAIYVVPDSASAMRWLEEQFTWEHRMVVEQSFERSRKS